MRVEKQRKRKKTHKVIENEEKSNSSSDEIENSFLPSAQPRMLYRPLVSTPLPRIIAPSAGRVTRTVIEWTKENPYP